MTEAMAAILIADVAVTTTTVAAAAVARRARRAGEAAGEARGVGEVRVQVLELLEPRRATPGPVRSPVKPWRW